jgi:hypothetical protein
MQKLICKTNKLPRFPPYYRKGISRQFKVNFVGLFEGDASYQTRSLTPAPFSTDGNPSHHTLGFGRPIGTIATEGLLQPIYDTQHLDGR